MFEIKTELLTLNEYINIERRNKFAAASSKKKLTSILAFEIMAHGRKGINAESLYDIEIKWYRVNKKHDSDNVFFGVKFILDGFVKAKILKNDGRKNVRHIHNYIYDSNTFYNYCTVEFKEAK